MTTDAPRCRSCQAPGLTTFLSLGKMPLVDALLTEDDLRGPEPRYPLDVAFCPECSLVQILETVEPDVLFCRDYPYYSSFSDTLLRHSKANVQHLIASRRLGPGSLAVELASNDGYLLQYFAEAGIRVLGIDPARGPARVAIDKGIPTVCTFFTRELAQQLRDEGKSADVVIANNVLAHVADLNGFVEGIATLLKPEGVAVIEVPYVKDLIDHCEFDTIYHEHLCYFSVTALATLFRRHGLSLNHVERLTIHGGSLRLYIEPHTRPSAAVLGMLAAEAAEHVTRLGYYEDFAARVQDVKDRLLGMLNGLRSSGKRLAAYGAAAKGAVLLNYVGIGPELLEFVVDRNIHKQGRYMPGVQLPIGHPARIRREMPDYVLILAWNFKDEILDQLEDYRRLGGRCIIPIPSPVIV
jgi:SAM-dependent methyltransferase